jgi:copper(I)-binding protein
VSTALSRGSRLRLFTVLLAVVTTAMSGCSFLYQAETQRPVITADGVWTNTGDLGLRGVLVVSDEPGSGALLGMVVNSGSTDDRLVGISVDGTEVTPAPDLAIPAGGTVQLGQRGQGFDDATADMLVLTAASLKPGGTATLRLLFDNAPAVTLQVLVVDRDGNYADVPVPTATPTPAG